MFTRGSNFPLTRDRVNTGCPGRLVKLQKECHTRCLNMTLLLVRSVFLTPPFMEEQGYPSRMGYCFGLLFLDAGWGIGGPVCLTALLKLAKTFVGEF